MNYQELARAIRKFETRSTKKIVIAIDGYSGAGKTSLLRRLARGNKEILPVFIDDFINPGKKRRALLKSTSDKLSVMELEWNNIKKIKQLLRAFRTRNGRYAMKLYNPDTDHYDLKHVFDLSRKVLVLEGIFLFNSGIYRNLFDFRIFLDINTKIADARRIKREKQRWGKKYVPEDRPDSFTRLFKLTFARYIKRYKPKQLADLVIKV